MSSNRSNYEVCECPNSSSQIEYACNCGNPAVFLCGVCVISHLSKPRAHTFISIEQARALRNSDYNQQFTESFSKFMALKTVLQKYQDKITTFKTQVISSKQALKSYIDHVYDTKISQLESINIEVSKKIDQVSRQMSFLDQTGLATLEKYAASGLDGILPQYYDNLELREEDARYAVLNSILLCKVTEASKYLSYSDLATSYNKLCEQNNELQAILQSYSDHFDQIQKEEESKKSVKRSPQDLSYEESLEKFKITLENNKILYHDRFINKTIEYPIKLEDNSQISAATCCLSPDGDIFIVSHTGQYQPPQSFSLSAPRIEACCDTFKFSKENFSCVKLSNMNVRRNNKVALCFNGEYLYAFGGSEQNHNLLKYHEPDTSFGCTMLPVTWPSQVSAQSQVQYGSSPSGIAERMKWASQGWVKLPDMQLPRVNCGCYSVNNFIIVYDLQNSNRLEYFDVNALKFTLIEDFGFYTPSAIKRIDDLIYIMNVSFQNNIRVAVLSDEMKLIQSNNSLKPNTLCCFGRSREGQGETICFSYGDMKLKFHDVYDPDYAVIEEAKITLIH